jgi:mannose-6-phosphate isomerase-like protein (cupin superfamily)
VRLLCGLARGGMATFTLPANAVARAVMHRSVEEIWYVLSGSGRMWRCLGAQEDIATIGSGVTIAIPPATSFQFRADGDAPLVVLGVTMPPWPGANEALPVEGKWQPTV